MRLQVPTIQKAKLYKETSLANKGHETKNPSRDWGSRSDPARNLQCDLGLSFPTCVTERVEFVTTKVPSHPVIL